MFDDRWEYDVETCQRWRDAPKPTIAVVHGLCIYHAWAMASCCDLIWVAEDAQIMMQPTGS